MNRLVSLKNSILSIVGVLALASAVAQEFPLLDDFFRRRKSFLYEEEFTNWLKQRFEDEPTLVTTS